MTFILFRKILFLLILVMINGCSYEPLFNKNQQKSFTVKSFEVEGDKRVAQILINKLGILRDKSGKFNIIIFANKKTEIENKSSSGKIQEYSVTLNYKIQLKNNITSEVVYSKNVSNTQNYKSSKLYSESLDREKKIVENISGIVASQITNELSLQFQDDF